MLWLQETPLLLGVALEEPRYQGSLGKPGAWGSLGPGQGWALYGSPYDKDPCILGSILVPVLGRWRGQSWARWPRTGKVRVAAPTNLMAVSMYLGVLFVNVPVERAELRWVFWAIKPNGHGSFMRTLVGAMIGSLCSSHVRPPYDPTIHNVDSS